MYLKKNKKIYKESCATSCIAVNSDVTRQSLSRPLCSFASPYCFNGLSGHTPPQPAAVVKPCKPTTDAMHHCCCCGCYLQLSTDEVRRGFGAFYDSNCQVRGGSWAVYNFPGGQSCCRTCRWNKQDAVAAWLQPTELDDCPPCVKVRQTVQLRSMTMTCQCHSSRHLLGP
jgi:hypothetical protein